MHGWCAEKENRGKRGSGKGKIGAGVGSCRSMDPVGISSGSRRAPIFAFLGTAFGQSGSSRDPVGHQCREAAKCIKTAFLQCFCAFLGDLAASRQVQTWCQKFENWCPTGSRLDPDWPKAVPKNAKIGARPDWVPTGSRLGFFKKTPISLNLSTYFWSFSILPCTTPPPVLSQTRATQYIVYIYIYIDIC